jgi:hypothetical protein
MLTSKDIRLAYSALHGVTSIAEFEKYNLMNASQYPAEWLELPISEFMVMAGFVASEDNPIQEKDYAITIEYISIEEAKSLYPANHEQVETDMREMTEGMRVSVKLHGDDTLYFGIVLDRPRNMWVAVENHPSGEFIADENSIETWSEVDLDAVVHVVEHSFEDNITRSNKHISMLSAKVVLGLQEDQSKSVEKRVKSQSEEKPKRKYTKKIK